MNIAIYVLAGLGAFQVLRFIVTIIQTFVWEYPRIDRYARDAQNRCQKLELRVYNLEHKT